MTEIETQNKYITYMMRKLPEEKARSEMYVVKKGESLWKLAKNELGDATNAEISEYMLRIAKLNGLDTCEKMNSIKVSQKIYMPETVSKPGNAKSSKSTGLTSAEQSALSVISTIFEDKTVFVEKPYMSYESKAPLYHVYHHYKCPNGFESLKSPVMSFNMTANGELVSVWFEDVNENKNTTAYDYQMDKNGVIRTNNVYKGTHQGKISKEEFSKLEDKIAELMPKAETVF